MLLVVTPVSIGLTVIIVVGVLNKGKEISVVEQVQLLRKLKVKDPLTAW